MKFNTKKTANKSDLFVAFQHARSRLSFGAFVSLQNLGKRASAQGRAKLELLLVTKGKKI